MSISRSRARRWAGVATLSAVTALGLFWVSPPSGSATPTSAPRSNPDVAALESLSDAFASVAERIKPSVVYVTAKRTGAPRTVSMLQLPPAFRRFFDLPDQPRYEERNRRPMVASAGSGFIVSADGYILTNNHVVDGAEQVRVRLLDRREFDATVVGTDPTTDVAVLKIDADHLSPASLGSSDSARVGEWVLAVGNPFGENLTFTVTSGIISAKGRALQLPNQSSRSIQDFIQTDAAINPGNSGGPLVDIHGDVIGINSAIASPTGTYSGYGFAVPIDLARKVMDQIVESGRVDRVALGILARDAREEDATYAGLSEIRGVVVQDFGEETHAKDAGLKPGDVILAVDDNPVDYVAQLQERIAFRDPGDVVNLDVARKGGERATIRVRLVAVPDQPAGAGEAPGHVSRPDGSDQLGALGISVRPLDQELASELGLPDSVKGLLVADVDPEGAAARRLAPPRSGGPDIIEQIDGKPVRSVDQLREALAGHQPGEIVSLRIYNGRVQAGRVERIRLGGTD